MKIYTFFFLSKLNNSTFIIIFTIHEHLGGKSRIIIYKEKKTIIMHDTALLIPIKSFY